MQPLQRPDVWPPRSCSDERERVDSRLDNQSTGAHSWLQCLSKCSSAVLLLGASLGIPSLVADPPKEPVTIGSTPQYFIDDHIVDSRWALQYANGSTEMVVRVFHAPKKHAANPLIVPHKTFRQTDPTQPRTGAGFLSAIHDEAAGLFRIWYQLNIPQPASNPNDDKARRTGIYAIAYAESKDGL